MNFIIYQIAIIAVYTHTYIIYIEYWGFSDRCTHL